MYKHLLIILFLFVGCKKDNTTNTKNLAARYNGGTVTTEEIDNFIKDELYEQLFAVYYLRTVSLDEIIVRKLFLEEAKKQNLNTDELLEKEVYSKLSENGLLAFRKRMKIDSIMQDPKNPLRAMNVEKPDGKKILWEQYKKYQLEEYGLRLMKDYNVEKTLIPPLPQKSNLDSIKYISIGNKKSPVNFWLFSDFDCSSCKNYEPIFEAIYEKYKEKIEFRYTALTDDFRVASIACECASQQGQFKNMHDYIFKTGKSDSLALTEFMKSKHSDINLFRKCINDQSLKVSLIENLNKIKNAKILQTPSLYIDDRTYYGQINVESISIYIDNILSKQSGSITSQ